MGCRSIQEDRFTRLGLRLGRGTMCRWAEEFGATLGATVVEAMRDEAMRSAFCISADATGVLVQPLAGGDQARRGCRRRHFLVQIADADHIFFEYLAKETSAAIGERFRGFSGYVQADAKSVYDLLFKPLDERPLPDDGEPDLAERKEVGCWSHSLRDLIRIVPHWPRDRYLELAPRYWLATRAHLDATQLERELGPLDLPAPASAAEQPAAG